VAKQSEKFSGLLIDFAGAQVQMMGSIGRKIFRSKRKREISVIFWPLFVGSGFESVLAVDFFGVGQII
jgi:hypothetical protein